MLWVITAALLLLVVLLDVGIIHLTWRNILRREMGHHKVGWTSNNAKRYEMKVLKVRKKIWNYLVFGASIGPKPQRGDVLYLVNGTYRQAVLVKKVETESIPGRPFFRTELTVYGKVPKELIDVHRQELKAVFINNEREPSQLLAQEEVDLSAIRYPLIIRRAPREVLKSFFMILLGGLVISFGMVPVVFRIDYRLWMVLLCIGTGAFLIGIGFNIFRAEAKMNIRVEEDGTLVVRGSKGTETLTLDTVAWGIKPTEGKRDSRTLLLYTADRRFLTELRDTEEGFATLLALLESRMKLKNTELLFQSIRDKNWSLPLKEGELMTEQLEEGGFGLVLTDSPLRITQKEENVRFRDITLEEALEMTGDFSVFEALILKMELPSNGETGFFRYFMNKENYKKILGEPEVS